MKRFSCMITGLFMLSLLLSLNGWASKAYVTDSFRISLRRGPSIENKILKFLPSGQPVEILEATEGWSRIRLLEPDQNNLSGWVLSRYLILRLPWEVQTRSLTKKNTHLMNDLNTIEKELKETARREQMLSSEMKKYADALKKSQNDYEILKREAKNYLNLKAAHQTTQQNLENLTRENERLHSSQERRWFAIGALVLLCGLMIGLVLGKQEKRRRAYY